MSSDTSKTNDSSSPSTVEESPFSSWWRLTNLWNDFHDGQRLDRLKQCQELETLLRDCHSGSYNKNGMEESVCGIRMARYFGWRESKRGQSDTETQNDATNQKSSSNTTPMPPSCAKETHSLWGCRAIALGCGPDVVQLKDCFQQYNQGDLLAISKTSYEASSSSLDIPCHEFQKKLGDCVKKNAAELEERTRRRKRNQEKK